MKTYKILLSLILILLSFNYVFAQTNMSKKQIFNRWRKDNSSSNEKDSILANFIFSDSTLKEKIIFEVKKLNDQGIDTFGIFQIGFPGSYGKKDSCNTGVYGSKDFLFWISSNKAFYKRISGGCEYGNAFSLKAKFFKYYLKNSTQIDSENILPIIFGGQLYPDNKVIFSINEIEHEAKYKIYIQTNKKFRFFKFSESDVTNKQNLFYVDNIDSKLYKFVLLLMREFKIMSPN